MFPDIKCPSKGEDKVKGNSMFKTSNFATLQSVELHKASSQISTSTTQQHFPVIVKQTPDTHIDEPILTFESESRSNSSFLPPGTE